MTRERLLIGGEAKAGKTFSLLTIAQALPDSQFCWISPDDGERRLLEFEFQSLKNIKIYFTPTWPDVIQAQSEIEALIAKKQLTEKDWIITEGLDLVYNNLKHEFIEVVIPYTEAKKRKEKNPKELWEAILDRRARGSPILEYADWDAIHGQLETWLAWVAFRVPCHWGATTGITPRSDDESSELRQFYDSIGSKLKWDGQKRVPKLFDTLIVLGHQPGQYFFSVFSDRGSRWKFFGNSLDPAKHYANKDFYQDYLVKFAGWPEVEEVEPEPSSASAFLRSRQQ